MEIRLNTTIKDWYEGMSLLLLKITTLHGNSNNNAFNNPGGGSSNVSSVTATATVACNSNE
jgi:hypothetical protein